MTTGQIMPTDSDFEQIASDLRRHDRDRYLSTLFAPSRCRMGLLAVYGFNLEIARVRETTSEELIGHMRLQWWRDRLEDIFAGTPPKHPVAEPLAWAVQEFGLDRALFDGLIDGRVADLIDTPSDTLDGLVGYAESTASPVMVLALQILGQKTDQTSEAARHAGIAQALVGILRAVPFVLRARRFQLPVDLCRDAGLDLGRLYDRGPVGQEVELAAVVSRVADRARTALVAGRACGVSRRALPAFMPARLAARDIGRLRKADWNPFDDQVLRPDGLRPLILLGAAIRGKF